MRLVSHILGMLILVCMVSCSSGKSKATPNQLNKQANVVTSKNYKIISDLAFPQLTRASNALQNSGLLAPGSNVSRIDLLGNENYVKIIGDSIHAELPYFGERQFNVAYNGRDTSIRIKNSIQNYVVQNNTKDSSYQITFETRNQTESFKFNIKVFPDLSSDMIVVGSTRFSIRYSGAMKPLD